MLVICFEKYASLWRIDLSFQDFERATGTSRENIQSLAAVVLLASSDAELAGCDGLRPIASRIAR